MLIQMLAHFKKTIISFNFYYEEQLLFRNLVVYNNSSQLIKKSAVVGQAHTLSNLLKVITSDVFLDEREQ